MRAELYKNELMHAAVRHHKATPTRDAFTTVTFGPYGSEACFYVSQTKVLEAAKSLETAAMMLRDVAVGASVEDAA